VTGIGPGRFAAESEVAQRDQDARWAHNEYLQQGAEEGLLGLVVLVALVGWGFLRAWTSPSPDAVTALGVAALGIVAIHASVDYIFHFPAIPVAAAALLGATQASSRPARRDRTETDELDVVGA
jgi:O-antigen ligase